MNRNDIDNIWERYDWLSFLGLRETRSLVFADIIKSAQDDLDKIFENKKSPSHLTPKDRDDENL